jgi:hypothetical protein
MEDESIVDLSNEMPLSRFATISNPIQMKPREANGTPKSNFRKSLQLPMEDESIGDLSHEMLIARVATISSQIRLKSIEVVGRRQSTIGKCFRVRRRSSNGQVKSRLKAASTDRQRHPRRGGIVGKLESSLDDFVWKGEGIGTWKGVNE